MRIPLTIKGTTNALKVNFEAKNVRNEVITISIQAHKNIFEQRTIKLTKEQVIELQAALAYMMERIE